MKLRRDGVSETLHRWVNKKAIQQFYMLKAFGQLWKAILLVVGYLPQVTKDSYALDSIRLDSFGKLSYDCSLPASGDQEC